MAPADWQPDNNRRYNTGGASLACLSELSDMKELPVETAIIGARARETSTLMVSDERPVSNDMRYNAIDSFGFATLERSRTQKAFCEC